MIEDGLKFTIALLLLANVGLLTWAIFCLARHPSPKSGTSSHSCKPKHAWIPIGAQPARGEGLAYEQTFVLFHCRVCGIHVTHGFAGKWELQDFLKDEWSVEKLERMAR